MGAQTQALKGSWLRSHTREMVAHGLVLAGFLAYMVFLAQPLFDRFEGVPDEARLTQVELPRETDNILYSLDKFVRSSSALEVQGWALLEGEKAAGSKTFLVLKSDTKTYVFDTFARYTPHLNDEYGGSTRDLEWSGFITTIPLRKVEPGTYGIGFYITNGEAGWLQYADQVVTKAGGDIKITQRAAASGPAPYA